KASLSKDDTKKPPPKATNMVTWSSFRPVERGNIPKYSPRPARRRPTMRKHLDRIRFRGQRRDEFLDLADSPNTSDTECTEEAAIKPPLAAREVEEQLREAGPGTFSAAFHDDSRTDLNEVKGHLEIALLEKHFLQEELKKLKEESNVDSLRQELERERSRCSELELKINDVLKPRWVTPRRLRPTSSSSRVRPRSLTWSFLKWLYGRFGVYIEDFRFQPEEPTVEPEEPLSAKRLTENMRRLKRGFKPVTNFKRNLTALSSWNSVYTSAIAFIVYMYAAWHGWAVPMFLFLAILRLSLNCLIARSRASSASQEPPKEELTVSEKFQLVLDVAQKAQNLFGRMANILEKIKNLFMWVQPELTQKLYVGLWVAFISSCLLPFQLLGFFIGVYAGIKFFIIDFVFKRCLKLRQRFDTPYIIWTNLPTDLQLKERGGTTLSRRVSPPKRSAAPPGVSRDDDAGRYSKRGAFHDVFSLPESERPLTVCEGGWRCCLINRDKKTPTDYIRNGYLYVTENHLCFESSSSRSGSSKKNKVIKLLDIIDIQKYKVLSVLPGSGMGISIATPSTQKPMVFGAMIHRDEAFDAISTQYMKIQNATAATGPETL
uniref:GRAM domain containing 4 n=1 Tax=Cyclopterus lumpus TaxID=8103 RepID=A0A8C2WPN5_CYCLU